MRIITTKAEFASISDKMRDLDRIDRVITQIKQLLGLPATIRICIGTVDFTSKGGEWMQNELLNLISEERKVLLETLVSYGIELKDSKL